MSQPCPFGLCDGSGFVMDEETNTDAPCRCRPMRVSQAKARRLEARIPRKYRDSAFDRPPVTGMPAPVVAEVRRYVRDVEANLDQGKGIWFFGDVGTGKTTLAMLVSKAALEAGRSVAIYSMPRLLNVLRQAIGSEESTVDLLDRLSAVDLLHIDDVGAERSTVSEDPTTAAETSSGHLNAGLSQQRHRRRAQEHDDEERSRREERDRLRLRSMSWVMEQLYSIVNARYEEERALVLTTNLRPNDLADHIGARTVSRIVEMCGDPLPLFGPDLRRALPDLRTA